MGEGGEWQHLEQQETSSCWKELLDSGGCIPTESITAELRVTDSVGILAGKRWMRIKLQQI